MTWKIELAALAVTAVAVGGYLKTADLFKQEPIAYHDTFTQADYNAFDRDFMIDGKPCEIGLSETEICLPEFAPDRPVRIGAPLPKNVPTLSASMRVLLALDSKSPELKTVRFGRTLVLIEPGSEIVHDVLRLDAPSYASARSFELVAAPIGSAAN